MEEVSLSWKGLVNGFQVRSEIVRDGNKVNSPIELHCNSKPFKLDHYLKVII